MKIAIPYDRGKIFDHFGHAAYFEIVNVDDGKVIGKMNVPTSGSGHEYMVSFLKRLKVNVVISSHMGKKAIMSFLENNIEVYIGLSGGVDDVVSRYLEGTLDGFNVSNLNLDLLDDQCDCN